MDVHKEGAAGTPWGSSQRQEGRHAGISPPSSSLLRFYSLSMWVPSSGGKGEGQLPISGAPHPPRLQLPLLAPMQTHTHTYKHTHNHCVNPFPNVRAGHRHEWVMFGVFLDAWSREIMLPNFLTLEPLLICSEHLSMRGRHNSNCELRTWRLKMIQ